MRVLLLAGLIFLGVSTTAHAGTSNSLMDVSPDGKLLLVANTDSGTVSIVDLTTRKVVCELPVGDHPEGVAWAGRVGVVTVFGDDRVVLLSADTKTVTHALAVEDEPYGVVTTKDGKFAYITHDFPGSITEIDVVNKSVVRSMPVGSGLRGIGMSADESTLYVVEFLTSKLIAVDRVKGTVTDSWPGYESDNLARQVAMHPTRPKAYLSHSRSRVTHFDARASIFPQLSITDLWPKPADKKRRRSIALDTFNGVYVTANPWESAASPDGKKLYTIYAGTNDANVCDIIDDDYSEIQPAGRPVKLGKHPRAVRVSPDGSEVYIYNTLDSEVTIHDPTLRQVLARVKVCTPAHTAEWRRGKELFQTARSPMGNTGWVSCSSCHPDGFSDGRVWQNPEGHRRTQHLFGLAHTHPLHWSADRDEVQDFEYTIRGKLMQGRGLTNERLIPRTSFTEFAELDQQLAGKSGDLDALAIYTNSFPLRLSPFASGEGKLSAEAARGKEIFFAKDTACATCHSGPYYTDSRLEKPYNLHDVGTGDHPAEKIGPRYDTPSLFMVYRNPPYLHDGRAKTLKEIFTKHNPTDKHGKTSHLSDTDMEALVAFMKSLPYEMPPDETPNTVKHRIKLTEPTRPNVVTVKRILRNIAVSDR